MKSHQAREQIAVLISDYGLVAIPDAGGIEVRHSEAGSLRLTGEDDQADLRALQNWLDEKDLIRLNDDTRWNDWEGIDY